MTKRKINDTRSKAQPLKIAQPASIRHFPAAIQDIDIRHFPVAVQELKAHLLTQVNSPIYGNIGEELELLRRLNFHGEAVKMWRALESREIKRKDDEPGRSWVHEFLMTVMALLDVPKYMTIPKNERDEHAEKIRQLSDGLIHELKSFGLDRKIMGGEMRILSGKLYFHDFGQPAQAKSTHIGNAFAATELISEMCRLAVVDLTDPALVGKAGKNAQAIKLARGLVAYNRKLYGRPLNETVAIACNAVFDTTYTASDIAQYN